MYSVCFMTSFRSNVCSCMTVLELVKSFTIYRNFVSTKNDFQNPGNLCCFFNDFGNCTKFFVTTFSATQCFKREQILMEDNALNLTKSYLFKL